MPLDNISADSVGKQIGQLDNTQTSPALDQFNSLAWSPDASTAGANSVMDTPLAKAATTDTMVQALSSVCDQNYQTGDQKEQTIHNMVTAANSLIQDGKTDAIQILDKLGKLDPKAESQFVLVNGKNDQLMLEYVGDVKNPNAPTGDSTQTAPTDTSTPPTPTGDSTQPAPTDTSTPPTSTGDSTQTAPTDTSTQPTPTGDSTQPAPTDTSTPPTSTGDSTQTAPTDTSTPTTQQNDGSTTQPYTVQPGDDLWAIASKLLESGATPEQIEKEVDQIVKLNADKIQNPNLIYANEVLKVPAGSSHTASEESSKSNAAQHEQSHSAHQEKTQSAKIEQPQKESLLNEINDWFNRTF